MDCFSGQVLFVLLVLTSYPAISLPAAGDSHSLYNILQECHLNLSQTYPEYQSIELLELIEPMLAFINGSYNQWLLESSLHQLDPDIFTVEAAFDEYSFNSSVRFKMAAHCESVTPQLTSCLIETMNTVEIPDKAMVTDLITGLSQRYCNGTTPKSDVLAVLEDIYLPIGDVYDTLWPRAEKTTPVVELEMECGTLESLTEDLLQIAQEDNSLLSAIVDVEETILTTVRCYAVVLHDESLLTDQIQQIMLNLTTLTLKIESGDVRLLQYERQTTTKTTESKAEVKITKAPSKEEPHRSTGSTMTAQIYSVALVLYLLAVASPLI